MHAIGDSESFYCRFSNASTPFTIISNDDTAPDVVDGVLASPYVSIPILNTQNSSYISGITVSIVGQDFGILSYILVIIIIILMNVLQMYR